MAPPWEKPARKIFSSEIPRAFSITGFSLHFSDPSLLLVPFALAAKIHDIAGVALIAAYLFFVIAKIISGNWW